MWDEGVTVSERKCHPVKLPLFCDRHRGIRCSSSRLSYQLKPSFRDASRCLHLVRVAENAWAPSVQADPQDDLQGIPLPPFARRVQDSSSDEEEFETRHLDA